MKVSDSDAVDSLREKRRTITATLVVCLEEHAERLVTVKSDRKSVGSLTSICTSPDFIFIDKGPDFERITVLYHTCVCDD